jgi:hypothetical protein
VAVHPAAPSGRFAALLAEVHIPEPYEITAKLVIMPPSWRQQQEITACQGAFAVANSQLQEMLTPQLVPQLDDEGKPILDDEGKPVMKMEVLEVDPARISRINEIVEKSADRYNRALFGEQYGAVMEFFQDRPAAEWNAFYKDIQNEFMPLPEGGACPTCGHIFDEEQAGKPDASTS